MNRSVFGTYSSNSNHNFGRSGVNFSFMVDKKTDSDPDVIVNMSGMTRNKIEDLVNEIIKPISGVKVVKVEIGNSLLY